MRPARGRYLKAIGFDKPPSPLSLWLESWRLQRLTQGLFALGVDVKEDIIDLNQGETEPLGMRLLEKRRWDQAVASLPSVIANDGNFDFSSSKTYAVPTLPVWLESLRLSKVRRQRQLQRPLTAAPFSRTPPRPHARTRPSLPLPV